MSPDMFTWILSGLNVGVLYIAIRKMSRLELMVETMWQAFVQHEFLRRSDDATAHDR